MMRITFIAVGFLALIASVKMACAVPIISDDFATFDSTSWQPHRGPYLAGAPEESYLTTIGGRHALFMRSILGDEGQWEARGYGSNHAYTLSCARLTAHVMVASASSGEPFMLHLSPTPWLEDSVVSVYMSATGSVNGAIWIGNQRHYATESPAATWKYGEWYDVGIYAKSDSTQFFLRDDNGTTVWSGEVSHTIGEIDRPYYVQFFSNLTDSSITDDKVYIDQLTLEVVPEPSSILALLCGVSGMGAIIWKRRK